MTGIVPAVASGYPDSYEPCRRAGSRPDRRGGGLRRTANAQRGDDDGLASLVRHRRCAPHAGPSGISGRSNCPAHGKSWAEIATHLGVTRQSAWERWRDLDDSPRRRRVRPQGRVDGAVRRDLAPNGDARPRAASGLENTCAQRGRARMDRSARRAGRQGAGGDQCPTGRPDRPGKPRLGRDRPKPGVRRKGPRRIGGPIVASG